MRRCEVIMWLDLLCKPKVQMFLGCSVCIKGLRGLVWVEALGCLVCDELVLWSSVCVEVLRGLIFIELIFGRFDMRRCFVEYGLDRIDDVSFGLRRGFEGFDLGRIGFGGFGLCICHSLVGYMEGY